MSAFEISKVFSYFLFCLLCLAGSTGLIAIEKIVTHRVFANTTKILSTLVAAQDYILNLNGDVALSQVVRGKMLEDSRFF